ncbi:MAG: TonB-dependent receptor [candidate division Zixibacteria bacterium]|nr:TonB-dependent receptor [candidate division Zixibacteria bacterium]
MKINQTVSLWVILMTLILLYGSIAASEYAVDSSIKQITGVVVDQNGRPISNANITIPNLNKVIPSDSEGLYIIKNLPSNTFLIEISHVGYTTVTLEINPTEDSKHELRIVLNERAGQSADIVVTGSPIPTDPMKSPQDIQILGGQKLLANETAALGKTLERLPGISNISTGPQAGKPVIRGLSGNRVRVMKDGVPMEHYQFSFRHQPVLNLAQAERVEVVQGAASILYGSDALGGAANVITKSLPSVGTENQYMKGLAKGQYFSNNQEWSSGLELEGATGVLGYRAGFTTREADNFSTPDEPTYAETSTPSDPKFTGELPYTNFIQNSGFVMLGFSGSFGNLQTIYDRYDSEQNYLLGDGSPIAQNLENDNFKIKANFLAGPKLTVKPTLSFQRNVRQAAEGVSFEDKPEWKFDLVRSVYAARLDIIHSDIRGLSGTVGIDLNIQDQETRASGLLPNADIFDLGLFAFEEYSNNDLTLNVGIRYDYREHEAEANAAMRLPDTEAGETDDVLTQKYSVFSGSAGASYRLSEFFTVASNFTIGFRAPDIFELHAYGIHGGVQAFQIGNPYLDPERSYGIDASLRLRTEHAVAKATFYHNRIDNYIFLENQGRDTTIGTTTLPILVADQTDGTISGIELSGEVNLFRWMRLEAAYSATTSENRATGNELPLMPADRIITGVRFSKPAKGILSSSFAEIRMKHVMSKKSAGIYEPFSQFDIIPFGTASTKAYTTFSIGFGLIFNFKTQPISVYLDVENLLDEAYVDFLDTYKGYALSMGRNVSLRIQVPFSVM